MTEDLERRVAALEAAVADLRRVVGTSEDWLRFAAGEERCGEPGDAAIAALGQAPAEGEPSTVRVDVEQEVYDALAARAARVGVSVEVFALGILRLQCWPEDRVLAVLRSAPPTGEEYRARLRALAERRPIRGITTDELMRLTRGEGDD